MGKAARVNVHPRPNYDNWDYHIPYHGNSYDQKDHVHDSYLNLFLEKVAVSDHLILVSNGEPTSRQIAVKKILQQAYSNVDIEQTVPCYNFKDPIFTKPWLASPKPNDLNDKEIVEYYLKHHQEMFLFSQRYQYQNHSRDHGYFKAVKRYWYQYGQDMPPAPDQYHATMYELFSWLFESVVKYLKSFPLNLPEKEIRKKLMFRLNHNPPNSEINNYLVPRHVDNSIITLWLYQNQSGSYVDSGQDTPVNETPLSRLHDSSRELILFPGLDYCDQLNVMTPATWHGVSKQEDGHRVSLVGFLKY